MRTLIYSVEERELGRDKEASFRATHHASCLSRPILLSSLNGCDILCFFVYLFRTTSPNQSVRQHMKALMFSLNITTVSAQIGP